MITSSTAGGAGSKASRASPGSGGGPVPSPPEEKPGFYTPKRFADLSDTLAQVINRIHYRRSVSILLRVDNPRLDPSAR